MGELEERREETEESRNGGKWSKENDESTEGRGGGRDGIEERSD